MIETLVDSELTTIQTTIDETTENNEISTDTPEVSTISDVGSTIENITDEALTVQLDNRDIDDTIELKELGKIPFKFGKPFHATGCPKKHGNSVTNSISSF